MVKLAIQIVRDAQYESQKRTVEVSDKPAVGKQLFSEKLAQASGGSLQGSFETERFLHGKIREYTLRSASHWQDVRAVLPDKTAQVKADFNGDQIREVDDALMYRIVAESIDHVIGSVVLSCIPKSLRAYVLAQMVQDSDMSIMSCDASQVESRAELQARLNLRRVLKRVGFSMKDGRALNINFAGLLVAASFTDAQVPHSVSSSTVKQISSVEAKKALAAVVYSLASPAHSGNSGNSSIRDISSKCMEQSFSLHSYNCSSSNQSKLLRTKSDSSSTTSAQYRVSLTIEEGFATAPIWYQQSMATGPPLQSSRWNQRID
jgi:hypothetical protein